MGGQITKALVQLTSDIADIRRIEYTIRSKEFLALFEKASNKEEVLFYIYTHNANALKEWIYSQRIMDLSTCTVRQLRNMARDMKIRDYNFLTKDDLIKGIKNAKQNRGDSGNREATL